MEAIFLKKDAFKVSYGLYLKFHHECQGKRFLWFGLVSPLQEMMTFSCLVHFVPTSFLARHLYA